MTTDIIKILVAGDTKGKFKELFDRVSTVNKKNGPFSALLCVGDFFPDVYSEDFMVPPAPISTFILGPTKPSQVKFFNNLTGCEIAENVTYLGQRGIYNDSKGLKIAYFSGVQSKSRDKTDAEFNYEDVKNFEVRVLNETGFVGVDVLLTSQWPMGVENNTNTTPTQLPKNTSAGLSRLAASLKPRYHFAGLEGIHYERPPYRNHQVLVEAMQHPTRFISLAAVSNPTKSKWLYAFNITPMKRMSRAELIKQPDNVTEFPFTKIPNIGVVDKSDSGSKASSNQFFYDTNYTGQPQHDRRGRGRNNKYPHQNRGGQHDNKRQMENSNDGSKQSKEKRQKRPCWFCLSSAEVEKHLVVSVGDSAYLTLAKGGLTDDHVLILPIGHFQSTLECPQEVSEDINKFKSSLSKYFASIDKSVVFFERSLRSPHLQVQAVPIPNSVLKGESLKIMCLEFAECEEIELEEFPSNADLNQMTKAGTHYFYLELPDGCKLLTTCNNNFPIQFGRELLASPRILNCESKIDWKSCAVSKEEETRLTQAFRNSFAEFDFTVKD